MRDRETETVLCPFCDGRMRPQRGEWDVSRVIGLPGATVDFAFVCPNNPKHIVFSGRTLDLVMVRHAARIEAATNPTEAEARFLRKYRKVHLVTPSPA